MQFSRWCRDDERGIYSRLVRRKKLLMTSPGISPTDLCLRFIRVTASTTLKLVHNLQISADDTGTEDL
jgi:hypothetical protein